MGDLTDEHEAKLKSMEEGHYKILKMLQQPLSQMMQTESNDEDLISDSSEAAAVVCCSVGQVRQAEEEGSRVSVPVQQVSPLNIKVHFLCLIS